MSLCTPSVWACLVAAFACPRPTNHKRTFVETTNARLWFRQWKRESTLVLNAQYTDAQSERTLGILFAL